MADIDDFANDLLEEAKRFLEKAEDRAADVTSQKANLHAALMLAFCSLEAHVSAIGDDFTNVSGLSVHERAILAEREVRLKDGQFELQNNILKMVRLEDRIQFLHAKFSGVPLDRTQVWWGQLVSAMGVRNELTHPKSIPNVTLAAVREAVLAIIRCVDALYQAIYKRPFLTAALGLSSKLSF
jgi:hypothetical protein